MISSLNVVLFVSRILTIIRHLATTKIPNFLGQKYPEKQNPKGPEGSRQGINDYTGFMAGDPEMQGNYYGYEGPCPPWNDELVHHDRFKLFTCDFKRCPVKGAFTGQNVFQTLERHVITERELVGLYSLNPDLG